MSTIDTTTKWRGNGNPAMANLRQELKKKKAFDSLEQEAALNLVRTNDQVQIQFTRLFREYDLTPSQYNILRILRGEGGPLPILEIADRTITVVPGITGLIDRLETAGLVRRVRSEDDRRVIFVELTRTGGTLLEKLDQPLLEMHQKVMKKLSGSELQQLIRLLEKVRDGKT